MPTYCKEHKRQATYNIEGQPPRFCSKCKTEDMVDVRNKRCHCGKSQPIYNFKGQKAEYCVVCKTDDMINVKSKRCQCGLAIPIYNFKGLKAKYCIDCKDDDMIDVNNKRCIHDKRRCWDCNPLDLLKYICRGRIRDIFPKHPNPEELLGTIDYQIVYNHIKSQMSNDMTCLNYGRGSDEWSLDHIIPILFDNPTDEEMKQRLHWSNLQPLFGNNQKQNTVRLEDIQTLANNWDTLTPELQIQVHHIRHNDDTLLYGILPKEEKKQKFKLVLKSKSKLN